MPFVKKTDEKFSDVVQPVIEVETVIDDTKYDSNRNYIRWTGFNFVELYHFCTDADHRLTHETVWIPGIGIVRKNTIIYRNPSGYYLKEEGI